MASQQPKPIELMANEAAAFVGCSYKHFFTMLNGDFPPPRLENKKFRSDQLGQWFREKIERDLTPKQSDDPSKINGVHERARKDKESADKLALENQVRRGELVEASAIEAAWSMILMRVKTRLMSIPTTLAPLVAIEDDKAQCQDLLDERVREALTELATAWGEDDANG